MNEKKSIPSDLRNYSVRSIKFNSSRKQYSEKYKNDKSINYLSKESFLSNYKNKIIDSFIFFGCWNQIDCSSKDSYNTPVYRDIIINKIRKEPEKLIILAGDNWYSQDFNEDNYTYKYYPFTTLISGYSLLLNNSNKEFDIILGNHDENNDKIKSTEPFIKKDCMLKIQKYVLKKIGNKLPIYKVPSLEDLSNISNSNMTINNINLFTCIDKAVIKEIKFGVYIIYINTNLFDNYTYKKKGSSSGSINNINTKFMLSYINYITKILKIYKPKLLFVMGHNPLIAYKKKKFHKLKNIYDDDEGGGANIMRILITELNKYKTIYLCADVHNFNIALLNNNLGTIISGTGGGDPDIEITEGKVNTFLLSPNDNIFNISDHYVYNAYGYTKIKYDKNYNVYVTYKQLFNAYKDKKFQNKIIQKSIKTYNFLFKNTDKGWELIKLKDRVSSNKITLDIPKLLKNKKEYCKILKSNKKNNITSLVELNQLVKSNNIKYNYLKNDSNTPLLCFYKKKEKKKK